LISYHEACHAVVPRKLGIEVASIEMIITAGDDYRVQDAETVVLDLMEPVGTARRSFGRGRQARFDEADYSATTL
jgi:hypothetical protein